MKGKKRFLILLFLISFLVLQPFTTLLFSPMDPSQTHPSFRSNPPQDTSSRENEKNSVFPKQRETGKHQNSKDPLERKKDQASATSTRDPPTDDRGKNPHFGKKIHALQDSSSNVYWVEAGANEDGSSKLNPAGNITYVLTNNVTANDTVKVKPGTYNETIESFPLTLTDHTNVTLTATATPSETLIHGTGNKNGINVTADYVNISGFTISNTERGIYINAQYNKIKKNTIRDSSYGLYISGTYSEVYKNNFLNNSVFNAFDDGSYNNFNTSNFGNYWDDYGGSDLDGDGVGDSSYSGGGFDDYYPLMHPYNQSDVYWVEAGAAGDGDTIDNPAENISYVLDHTVSLANSIIRVKADTYDNTIETFPLTLNAYNLTLKAAGDPSNTVITGVSGTNGINVTAERVNISGFTINNSEWAIYLDAANESFIHGNALTDNERGVYIRIRRIIPNSSATTSRTTRKVSPSKVLLTTLSPIIPLQRTIITCISTMPMITRYVITRSASNVTASISPRPTAIR